MQLPRPPSPKFLQLSTFPSFDTDKIRQPRLDLPLVPPPRPSSLNLLVLLLVPLFLLSSCAQAPIPLDSTPILQGKRTEESTTDSGVTSLQVHRHRLYGLSSKPTSTSWSNIGPVLLEPLVDLDHDQLVPIEMSSWDHSSAADGHKSYTMWQGMCSYQSVYARLLTYKRR